MGKKMRKTRTTAKIESRSTLPSLSKTEDVVTGTNDNNGDNGGEGQVSLVDANSRLYKDEHPMLNPMIVSKVIQYLNPNIEELKVVREVCNCWYEVTFALWRSKSALRLTDEAEVFHEKKGGGIPVGEFLKRFEDPNDPFQLASKPYKNYTFFELKIDMSICEKEGSETKRFWEGVGPLMEYAHFNRCTFPMRQYMAFEQLVFEKLPNLKSLSITDSKKDTLPSIPCERLYMLRAMETERVRLMKGRQINDHPNLKSLRVYGMTPVKLKRLIGRLPNLENLTIRNSIFSASRYDDDLMFYLLVFLRRQRLDSKHTKFNLRTLDLMHSRTFYTWFSVSRLFSQVRFPLQTLSVEIKPDQSLNHQALKPLLEAHSATLQKLKVFCPPLSNTNFHDTFPFDIQLESLNEMQLWGNVVRNLKFLKFTPNLRHLLINRYCIEKWHEVVMKQQESSSAGWPHSDNGTYISPFSDDMVQKTVQECDMSLVEVSSLKLIEVDYAFSEVSLTKLKEWAPNLWGLMTILSKKSLAAVCKLWPDLKHLHAMSRSDLDDEIITGWKFDGNGQPKKRIPGACLTDLKDLRKFELDTLCGKSKLTDKSAIYGFMQLQRLEGIRISVSAKFSPEMETKLKEHIPLVKVNRNYGKRPHCHCNDGKGFPVCCFHKKIFESLKNDNEARRQGQSPEDRGRDIRRLRDGRRVAGVDGVNPVRPDNDSHSSSSDDDDNDVNDDEMQLQPNIRRLRQLLGF